MTIVQMGLFVLDTNPLASPPPPQKKKSQKMLAFITPHNFFRGRRRGGREGGTQITSHADFKVSLTVNM